MKYSDDKMKDIKKQLYDKYKLIGKPHVVVIKVGDNPETDTLLEHKKSACEKVGIKFSTYVYKSSVTTEHLKKIITRLSLKPTVTGIVIQTPLPDHINERELIDEIDPLKDIEGVTLTQAGMLHLGIDNKNVIVPYIAKAVYKAILDSKELQHDPLITVIGSDHYIGKAIVSLLEEKNIGVISCPSNVKNIDNYTDKSSMLVLISLGNSIYSCYRYLYGDTKKVLIDLSGNTIDIDSIERKLADSFTYLTSDDLEELIITEMIDNISIAYMNQFDFIWNYCQNLNIKPDNEFEDDMNVIDLEIPEQQWYITQENFNKYKDQLDNIDLNKKTLIIIPDHIKTIPMNIIEQFIKLFPNINRTDFYKYFEVKSSNRVKKKIYDTLNILTF